ncbi:MAG TPA: acyl-CoA desaturase, partial [Ktedonobacterales bacterium]|nr:acyl-CoA desaturase [Ktedonobacterales bacterium]
MASNPAYAPPQPLYRGIYKTIVLLVVLIPLVATVLAIRLLWQRAVHVPDLILLAVMYSLIAFGVTVGYHRMLTHRSFRAHPAMKLLLLILGSMAFEGPALEWAATHTKHHARADREGDPHSPAEGFFHAHLGWIFRDGDADPKVYSRHLLNDRIVMFVSKTFLLWAVLSLAIPFGIGWLVGGWTFAWGGLLWGG